LRFENYKKCMLCKEGYYLNENFACEITPEPSVKSCIKYDKNLNCLKCDKNFYLENQIKCLEVTTLIPFCVYYEKVSGNVICKLCEDAYYVNASSCSPRTHHPIDNCSSYDSSTDKCSICKDKFGITVDGLICYALIDNCEIDNANATDLKCTKCLSTFKIDPT
jgi:hypothetical protein